MELFIGYKEDRRFRKLMKEKIKTYNNKMSYFHKLSREKGYIKYVNIKIIHDNGFVAGLTARMYWECLEVDDLFVDEKFHKQGYGTQLLNKAIEIGKDNEKQYVLLSTFSFQALDFYKKFGFNVIGEIKDYPKGESLYTLRLDI
jgi:ribosomal protein S18 acetylase RimI-like enzyme